MRRFACSERRRSSRAHSSLPCFNARASSSRSWSNWRLALGEDKASIATTKRIRTLERKLARKEKALAEAAALLVLKKKLDHLWEDEDDDTDEESEK